MSETLNEISIRSVPVNCLIPSKTNPASRINDATIKELSLDIARRGVLEPIKARPLSGKLPKDDDFAPASLEIVFGHRRWAASKLASKETIPTVIEVLTPEAALEQQIVENLQSEDLHPLQEAENIQRLLKLASKEHKVAEDSHPALIAVAERLSKSVPYVTRRLKLLDLLPKAKQAFLSNGIQLGHAEELCRLTAEDQQRAIAWLLEGEYVRSRENGGKQVPGRTVMQLQVWIHGNLMFDLTKAPFDTADASLSKEYGACTTCPHRTGANQTLFSDITKGDWCTVPKDFFHKRNLTIERKVAEMAKERGVSKLLRVGVGDSYDNTPKHDAYIPVDVYIGTWNSTAKEVSKGDECQHTKPGIVVFMSRNIEGKMFSEVNVCTKPGECSKHSRETRSSSGPREKVSAAERDQKRVSNLTHSLANRQRDALTKAICEKAIAFDKKVKGALRTILEACATDMKEMLYSDRHRELCKDVLGLDPHKFQTKSPHSGPDYDEIIDSVFEKRPLAWLVACSAMNDVWRGEGSREALTKVFKIDVRKLNAQVKAEVDAKIEAIKAAAKRREAKKAKQPAKKAKAGARPVPPKAKKAKSPTKSS